jgi:serine/threonine-protein kinase
VDVPTEHADDAPDRLGDLLLEWEDRRGQGQPIGPEALCPDDPALRRQLADRIRLLEAYDALMSPVDGAAPPTVPDRIGKYEVLDTLGSGGMGVVYRAHDPVLRRVVAVKVIQPRHAAVARDRALARFAREAQTLARLDHPNIVRVYEAEVRDGPAYLVMEYVHDGSLAAQRERLAKVGARGILALVEKVARAVQYAHSQGVLHRDLKPANILLGDDGEPRVADFGLAALLTTDDAAPEGPKHSAADTRTEWSVLTSGAGRPGTPAYMAPEQFDPAFGPIGPGTDVWAIGIILYELLTGLRPFADTPQTPLPDAVARSPMPPPAGVSGRLAAVVARCLEKRPEKRFGSAGELADALRRLQGLSRRSLIRRAVLAGGALLAAGVPIGILASDPYRRFRWSTHDRVRSVRAGRPIDLVEPGGPLPAHYLRCGDMVTQIGMSPEGLVVRSPSFAVLELLPELPDGDCDVELELRHDNSEFKPGGDGCLGLFFAAARVRWENLTHHFLGYTTFDDFERKPVLALANLWYAEPAPGADAIAPPYRMFGPDHCANYVTPAPAGPKPFRSLRFRISPERTQVTWDGPPRLDLGPFRAADTTGYLNHLDRDRPGLGPVLCADYKPRLGVFVAGGKITVRKFRISPISA